MLLYVRLLVWNTAAGCSSVQEDCKSLARPLLDVASGIRRDGGASQSPSYLFREMFQRLDRPPGHTRSPHTHSRLSSTCRPSRQMLTYYMTYRDGEQHHAVIIAYHFQSQGTADAGFWQDSS